MLLFQTGNGKRKPRRLSLIRLPFAHHANESLSFVRLLMKKQTSPFANGLNRLARLWIEFMLKSRERKDFWQVRAKLTMFFGCSTEIKEFCFNCQDKSLLHCINIFVRLSVKAIEEKSGRDAAIKRYLWKKLKQWAMKCSMLASKLKRWSISRFIESLHHFIASSLLVPTLHISSTM
jgi:hypothetical protein